MKRIILVDLGEREPKKRNALRAASITKTPLKSVGQAEPKKRRPGKPDQKTCLHGNPALNHSFKPNLLRGSA